MISRTSAIHVIGTRCIGPLAFPPLLPSRHAPRFPHMPALKSPHFGCHSATKDLDSWRESTPTVRRLFKFHPKKLVGYLHHMQSMLSVSGLAVIAVLFLPGILAFLRVFAPYFAPAWYSIGYTGCRTGAFSDTGFPLAIARYARSRSAHRETPHQWWRIEKAATINAAAGHT